MDGHIYILQTIMKIWFDHRWGGIVLEKLCLNLLKAPNILPKITRVFLLKSTYMFRRLLR